MTWGGRSGHDAVRACAAWARSKGPPARPKGALDERESGIPAPSGRRDPAVSVIAGGRYTIAAIRAKSATG
ncbi:hypothetical protein B7486_05260 [cyanobacterium TDX16]|nr:hypothetical protein B7486_05260 [cyanobacterium TDX16]